MNFPVIQQFNEDKKTKTLKNEKTSFFIKR